MQSNRSTGTGPEAVLSRLLRKRIRHSNLPGSPDFVYERARVAVFVHGCWWHRCPIDAPPLPKVHITFWKRKFERNVERDAIVKRELEEMGWKVVTVWEHETRQNPAMVARMIRTIVRSRNARSRVPSPVSGLSSR